MRITVKTFFAFFSHRLVRTLLHVLSAWLVFFFVSRRVHLQEVINVLRQFNAISLIPVIFFGSFAFLALSLRWKMLLGLMNVSVPLKEVVLTNGRALFYGLFLPGHITSDLLKGWMMDRKQEVGEGTKIAFSVLFDKLLGLIALCFVGSAALFFVSFVSRAVAIGGLLFSCVAFLFIQEAFLRIPLSWLRRWSSLDFLVLLRQEPRARRVILSACGWSLASQLGIATSAAALAWGLGISQPFLVMVAYALSAFFTAFPVTFAGIGVREGVFIWTLQKAQISSSLSLVLAECLFFMTVLYGISAWLYKPFFVFVQNVRQRSFSFRYQRLIGSLGLAFVFLLPSALFQLGSGYRGIYPSASSDEVHYVSMMREVSEGYILHPNTYIFEERNGAANIFQWNEVVVGQLFRLWPWGVDWFVWWVRFFSLAFSAWLLVGFLHRWRSRTHFFWIMAAACAWFVLPSFLGPVFFTRVIDTLIWRGGWSEFLQGFRFINPVVTVLLLLGGVELVERLHQRPSAFRAVILGLLIASTNYLYIYFWMALGVYVGLWLLMYLGRKDWMRAKRVVLSLFVGLVLSLPFWVFVRHQIYSFTLQTPISIVSHIPIIEKSVWASVMLFFVWTWWIIKKREETFTNGILSLSALALTAILAVNQHVFTGHVVQPHHFYWMVDLPIASFLLVVVLADLVARFFPRLSSKFGCVAFFVIAFLGFAIQAQTIKNTGSFYRDLQRLQPAFALIDRDPAVQVVYSDDRISELVPMYTRAYVSYALHSTAYLTTSQERRRWALFVRLFLGGATNPEAMRRKIVEERERIGMEIFEGQHYRERCGSYGCFPEEVFEQLVQEMQDLLKQDFQKVLFRYRLDVVLWDERAHSEWQLERFPFLERVWTNEGMSVWKRRL